MITNELYSPAIVGLALSGATDWVSVNNPCLLLFNHCAATERFHPHFKGVCFYVLCDSNN